MKIVSQNSITVIIMRKKIIGIIFFSIMVMGVISCVNACTYDTPLLERDRDRVCDRDRDKIMDCIPCECDKLKLRDRYSFRNNTDVHREIKHMFMYLIDGCDHLQLQFMYHYREQVMTLCCGYGLPE